VLARKNGAYLLEYGNPFGYLPLREHLVLLLAELGITAQPGQILLTHGTSQALELVIRYLLKPGDTALVDDPATTTCSGTCGCRACRCWRCRAIRTARTSRRWSGSPPSTVRRSTSPSR
jgi:histidinol-phosphate/aromatic aminotransferase/cobyric acid decarboxylase-like protein